jgi:hypothetical protein
MRVGKLKKNPFHVRITTMNGHLITPAEKDVSGGLLRFSGCRRLE